MSQFTVGRWSCVVAPRDRRDAPETDDWDFQLTAKLNQYSETGGNPLDRFRRSLDVPATKDAVGGIALRCQIYVASNGGFRWVADGKAGSMRKSENAVALAQQCVGFWEAKLQDAEQEAKALHNAEQEFQAMANERYEPTLNV